MMPGVILSATIVFVFVGIPLIFAGCIPAYYVHAKKLAWDLRDQALDEDRDGERPSRPWE